MNFETLKEDYEAVPKNAEGKPKVKRHDWETRKGFTQRPETEAPISNFTVLHKGSLVRILNTRLTAPFRVLLPSSSKS